MLKHVKKLSNMGFSVHLLKKKSKAPANAEWSTVPTLSYEKLELQYKDGMNVGVRLGKWSKVCGYYLHVIDFDIRDPKKLAEARDTLDSMFPDYQEYPVVQSGSMGESRHYYILTNTPYSSRKLAHADTFTMVYDKKLDREVKKWDWEIELFGTGKQVVLPPSIHDVTGKPYVWLKQFDFTSLLADDDGPIVDDDLMAALTLETDDAKYDPTDERYAPLGMELDEIEAILKKLPVDDWIEDREGWYRMGMAIHHETGGSKEGFDLWVKYSKLSAKYNQKQSTKSVWKSFKNRHRPFRMASLKSVARDVELEEMLENAFDDLEDDMDLGDDEPKAKRIYADDLLGKIGDDDEIEFDDLSHIPDIDDEYRGTKRDTKIKKAQVEAELGKQVPPKIARMNKTHFVVRIKSKTVIGTEFKDGSVEFGSVTDFNNYYENDRVSSEKSTVPLSKAWLQHKQRRNYSQGVVFEPKNTDPDYYNLWRGWSVEPDASKSCKLFLKHCKKIICRDDEECYRYLIGWLAHMVQFPEDKPGVATVVRGRKGAGKDTIAVYFSGILKHHYMMINQREHLVGRFNDHQKNLMFLHVEEGYWAGSKQDEGPLKSIITSPTVTIEPKGVNAFQINSVMRIFMTSNEKWVVPAGDADERRYFVIDADDAYSRSGRFSTERKEYFDAIRYEMLHGGREALLAYLMDYDLSGFDVRDPPDTAALDEQKMMGLKNVDRWWADQLMMGDLAFDTLNLSASRYSQWEKEPVMALGTLVYESYENWFRKQRYEGNALSDIQLGIRLHQLCPGMDRKRVRIKGERTYVHLIPDLRTCQRSLDAHLGTRINWHQFDILDGKDIEPEDDMDDEI